MSDPLDLFPGVAPPLLATLSAPAVLRAGACCRRWRDVTRRVAGRRTAEGAGPAAVALLVRTEECEGRSEVACALAALTRNLQWAPEVALIFATEDAACYSDGNGVRTLEADARARLPRACLVACGRAPGVFGPVAGALQEVVDAGGCAVLLLRGTRGCSRLLLARYYDKLYDAPWPARRRVARRLSGPLRKRRRRRRRRRDRVARRRS